jgi:hypothetical protein
MAPALLTAEIIAKSNHLRIVQVTEHGKPAWVVYRKLPCGGSARLGRRSTPEALLAFIRKLAGVSAPAPSAT